MSRITLQLKEIIEQYGWEYITQKCLHNDSDIIVVKGYTIDKETLLTIIQCEYEYYEIAFETVDSFIFEFTRVWNKNYPDFINKCRLYNQAINDKNGLQEYSHNYKVTSKGDNKYSDTPNEPMDSEESTEYYLTDRTKYTQDKTIEDNMSLNPLEKYGKIKQYINEPLNSFLLAFKNLFLDLFVIKTTKLWRI